MKKLLLSLAMLLTGVGAWGQNEIPTVKFDADALNGATETKRIAIRCTQESSYNTFYNYNNTDCRTGLPWTADMIVEWEPTGDGDGTHYIKKAYYDNGDENIYLLNTNITSFGPKTDTNIAKFKALLVSGDISNSGLNSDDDKAYWVRLAIDKANYTTFFNFNGSVKGYNNGTGVWTVQHVMDMTEYHKITINITKDGATETTTRIATNGTVIEAPEYFGYTRTGDASVTKDGTDTQVWNLSYTTNMTVKTLTEGNYLIYYTDADGTKHYLQTAGTNSITTVTEDPLCYAVSNGTTTDGAYENAYYLVMNNLKISNTASNATNIETKATNQNTVWTSQVFLEKDGKCAIRLTNATAVDQWHGNYFIGKGETEGSTVALEPTAANEDKAFIWEIEEPVEITYTLTDMLGNTFTGTTVGFLGNTPALLQSISGISACTVTDATWNGNNVSATITYPFQASSEQVENPIMISSFSQNAFKWYADGTSVKATKDATATSEDVMKYLWAIYPSFADGALAFTIKNMATGTYINSTSNANSHDEGTVTLSEDATKFTVESNNQFKSSTGKYLSLNSSNTDATQLIGTGNSHPGTQNAFPIQSYDVNIGSIEAATLYTPFAVTIPAETKAKYIVADGNSDALTTKVLKYTTLENTIPANTAVVILGAAGSRTFTKATEEPEAVENNLLFGYSAATTVAETEYSSKVGTSGTIFALHGTNTPATFGHFTGSTFRAGKAYLDVSSLGAEAQQVRYFFLVDDNVETGIEDIRESSEEGSNGAAYDLSGRRVKPTANGMYIINGKKLIK